MKPVIIGGATLYCGDCMDILPTLPNVDAVITDPPYGMSFQSNHRLEKHLKIANDDTADLARAVIDWAIKNTTHSVYAFGRWDNIKDYPKPKSLVTWVKNNWSMGDLHHEHARQTEVAFFYAGADHTFPEGRPTDVISYARTANEFHPTEKPVGLMAQFIKWTAGTILDPFMGSGTTGVACMMERRRFVGVEMNHHYFKVARKRIENAQPPLLLDTPAAPVAPATQPGMFDAQPEHFTP